MSETTTDNAPKDQAAGWQQAAAASAEAQRPEDPKPRYFTERLPVMLTERERVQVAIKYADARNRIDDFDAETKAIASERKAAKAKLQATAKEYEDATRTGRVMREVRCAEFTSFAQNRKYKVRLDTNEEIAEVPLSNAERQRSLPLDETKADAEDETPATDAGSDDPDEQEDEEEEVVEELDEDDELVTSVSEADVNDELDNNPPSLIEDNPTSSVAEPDDTTNITDPEALVGAGDNPASPTPAVPPSRPVNRRNGKPAKRSTRKGKK